MAVRSLCTHQWLTFHGPCQGQAAVSGKRASSAFIPGSPSYSKRLAAALNAACLMAACSADMIGQAAYAKLLNT